MIRSFCEPFIHLGLGSTICPLKKGDPLCVPIFGSLNRLELSNLLLNLTPDDRGLLPEADVARVIAFGEELRYRFGCPLSQRSGEGIELACREQQIASHTRIDDGPSNIKQRT